MYSLNASGFLIYQLSYLLLYPRYTCWKRQPNGSLSPIAYPSADFTEYCQPHYFCSHKQEIVFKRDYDCLMTLNNLILKYNADCWDPIWISLPAMMFFLGWTLGSLWLPAYGDQYGRKKLYVLCLCGTLATMVAILLLPSSKPWFCVLIGIFFVNGVINGGRGSAGYCLMVEMAP